VLRIPQDNQCTACASSQTTLCLITQGDPVGSADTPATRSPTCRLARGSIMQSLRYHMSEYLSSALKSVRTSRLRRNSLGTCGRLYHTCATTNAALQSDVSGSMSFYSAVDPITLCCWPSIRWSQSAAGCSQGCHDLCGCPLACLQCCLHAGVDCWVRGFTCTTQAGGTAVVMVNNAA
jgi:hypothetical protein